MTSINSSLSGMLVAQTRLGVSSNNIANQQSTATVRNGERVAESYQAQEVVQTNNIDGGVQGFVQPVDPATFPIYDPSHPSADAEGVVDMPNVSQEREVVNQIEARQSFEANLNMLKRSEEMLSEMLDVFG